MVTTTVTRPKYTLRPLTASRGKDRAYQDAWARLWRVSARLPALWKSKKNSVQVLREGRRG